MPFLGVEPTQEFASVAKQTIIGTGATAYSLNHSVGSANDLAVFVNNVRQEPTSAYTASAGTITFTSALASTDSCYIVYIARTFSSVNAEASSIGITELNVSDGSSGQALTTDGSGTLSFSTISSSTPTLDAVTGAGATTTNAITSGNIHAGDGTNISMDSSGNGHLKVNGNGYKGAIALDGSAMHIYHNSGSRDLIFGTNETERVRINGSNGDVKISNQLYFGTNLGDVISLYDNRLGAANMYGFGVASSTLYSRSLSLFSWYINQTQDGSSYKMQLNGNGRLTLKGSQSSSSAAQVYFMDEGSPGLVGGIEFTGSLGNGGGYNSSLQSSGELQYSAAGHFFADTSVVSSGIPGFWCRMNGDMTIGTYSGSTVLTEYLFDVSAGHLHIDGTLYQNSSSTNSDSKMKENVVTLTNCLNKVSQLRGVEFDWKDEYVREACHDVGLIAQEVESVIPEVVSEHEIGVGKKAGTGETLKSVDYSRLTAVLIEAVKELKTQNEALETRIATLENN